MAQRKQKTIAAHPGEILRTELMEPMGITAYQLAKALHLPGIYEIVREQRTISADIALRLGKYFGMTPPQLLAEAIIMGETPTGCAEIFCRLPNSTLDEVSEPVSATPSQPSRVPKNGYG
jgi:addiction module HigA family antidote